MHLPLAPTRLSLLLFALTFAFPARAQTPATAYAPPAFTDAKRRERVDAVLPEIDKLFTSVAAERHLPGVAWGVVLDGQLIHARSLGVADVEKKTPVATDTRFRIASMTKSFVALATLMLRDEGKLGLDDPVTQHLPEFRRIAPLTRDARPITIANLMTMTTGLPEDNPWGDRQMEITPEALEKFLNDGLSFSNPPGQAYEYSNLGFVLLGRIVTRVSQRRHQDFITERILRPLGMRNTHWEFTQVPADKLALGYRWDGNAWHREPILHDGEGAALGGLITTLDDFARYVAFHLDAWPARDAAETGPVPRAVVREMHLPRIFSAAAPQALLLDEKTPNPSVTFYAYGLGWTRDSRGAVRLGHSGGLPGYGSNYRFAPDHGVGVMAFTNLRYGPVYTTVQQALSVLIERAKLPPRAIPTSPILATRAKQVAELVQSWSPALVDEIAAVNFVLDRSIAERAADARQKLERIGPITAISAIEPENQLRGTFSITGQRGKLTVFFTLSPERIPRVQALDLTLVTEQ